MMGKICYKINISIELRDTITHLAEEFPISKDRFQRWIFDEIWEKDGRERLGHTLGCRGTEETLDLRYTCSVIRYISEILFRETKDKTSFGAQFLDFGCTATVHCILKLKYYQQELMIQK
jgi:hypothetical protein